VSVFDFNAVTCTNKLNPNSWQTVRYKEACHEKEQKEDALHSLTTRERELRKRIEDMLSPGGVPETTSTASTKALHSKMNGSSKPLANGSVKRVKKRKAPS
jgi:COMPASS component SPP1